MKGCGEWEDRTPRPLTVVPLLTLPLVGNLSLQNTPFYEHNLSKPTKKAEGGDMTRKWGGEVTGMMTARSPPLLSSSLLTMFELGRSRNF